MNIAEDFERLVRQIRAMPHSALFVAEFATPGEAVSAIMQLSFLKEDQLEGVMSVLTRAGWNPCPSIVAKAFIFPKKTVLVIGGSLGRKEQLETCRILSREGEFLGVDAAWRVIECPSCGKSIRLLQLKADVPERENVVTLVDGSCPKCGKPVYIGIRK